MLRDLAQFALRPAHEQKARVIADSLRREGIAALPAGGVVKAMTLWRQSLKHALASGDNAAIAPVLVSIGGGFYRAGNYDSATSYLARGQSLASRIGDLRTQANATGINATIRKELGNASDALKLYGEAGKLRKRIGDSRGEAADQNNLGLIARETGNHSAARKAFQVALFLNRRDGRQSLAALNLSNLAGVAADLGQFARSDSLFRSALAIHRIAGDSAEMAFVLHDRGLLQTRRGDYDGAIMSLSHALRLYRASGVPSSVVAVQSDIAVAQGAIGELQAAMSTLRNAERDASNQALGSEAIADLALTRGDLAFHFDDYDEAETAFNAAHRFYASTRKSARRADALHRLATVRYARGDHDGALRWVEEAKRAYIASGDSRASALTSLLAASVLRTRGDLKAAELTALSAQRTLRTSGDVVGESASLEVLGNIEIQRKRPRAAKLAFSKALVRLAGRSAIDLRWRLHTGMGIAYRELGDLDSASRAFRQAIQTAEAVASTISKPNRRYGFLAEKWFAYTELALLEQQRGRSAESFDVSERLRAREMVEILSRGRIAPSRAELVAEQDYRKRVSEISGQLDGELTTSSLRGEPNRRQTPRSALARLNEAEIDHKRSLDAIRDRDPAYARTIAGPTVTVGEATSQLKEDEILLEYLLGDSACVVFVVTSDTVQALRLRISREALGDLIHFAKRAVEFPDANPSQPLWGPPLKRLYRELIQPVEARGHMRGKRHIVIVPHGELHFVSFAALISPQPDRFLVERFQISYAPSVTAWSQLRARARRTQPNRVLAMAPHVTALPASRDEVRAINRIYGNRAMVRLGESATVAALRGDLSRAGIVHLATFGVLNKRNPLFSFIRLAKSPGDDGRLEVNRIYDLGLAGQLVVLSACQTAVGAGANSDLPLGDDWIGLMQAFLQGGASSVVASLWPVDDRATASLMRSFHEQLSAGRPVATAVAEAQRKALRQERTRAPFYWAAFVVNGKNSAQ